MLSRLMLNTSKTSVAIQKRTFISIPDIFNFGFYCLTPLALSSLSLLAQAEVEDHQKLRTRVDIAKKGSSMDKAEAIEAAVISNAWGRKAAVVELLASVPENQKFDLSCGKSQPIRFALISSSISGDNILARQILAKSLNPCNCIILSERGIKLNCTLNKDSKSR